MFLSVNNQQSESSSSNTATCHHCLSWAHNVCDFERYGLSTQHRQRVVVGLLNDRGDEMSVSVERASGRELGVRMGTEFPALLLGVDAHERAAVWCWGLDLDVVGMLLVANMFYVQHT